MTPHRWLVLRVEARGGVAELLVEGLLALGGRAVWEEGTRLVTHLPEPDDAEAFIREAQARLRELTGSGDLELEASWQLHEEWTETWKRGLVPRRLTPRLVVTPSWMPHEAGPEDVVITLDPGMAFGNAEHGTTRGCLRLLDRALSPGERVLDLGAGSGVLAIAAARLGAAEVVAVDGDADACVVARENAARNGVGGRVTVLERWVDAPSLASLGRFDGALANLEGPSLPELVPALEQAVRPGGWLVLSGMLEEELRAVLRAAGGGAWAEEAVDADGEWRSLLLRRA